VIGNQSMGETFTVVFLGLALKEQEESIGVVSCFESSKVFGFLILAQIQAQVQVLISVNAVYHIYLS